MHPKALVSYQETLDFCALEADEALVSKAQAVLKKSRTTYHTAILFYNLSQESDRLTVRKACQSALKEVAKHSLTLPVSMKLKAEAAMKLQ